MATQVLRSQLSQQVAEILRREILNGRLPAGTWLRQDHIARQLGVSPIPVREAFKTLHAQGLVEHVPYKGIRVVQLSPEEVEDLYAVRAFAEARAAAEAAKNITDEELEELRNLCDEMDLCATPDELACYRELNRRFHTRIAAISGRPCLIRLLEQLWAAYPTMLWANYPHVAEHSLPSREATDSAEHAAIVAALSARDPQRAADAVAQHVERAGQELVAFVRAQLEKRS